MTDQQERSEYETWIIERLSKLYSLDEKQAKTLFNKVEFDRWFDKDPEYVFYRQPRYWAEWIYERAQEDEKKKSLPLKESTAYEIEMGNALIGERRDLEELEEREDSDERRIEEERLQAANHRNHRHDE